MIYQRMNDLRNLDVKYFKTKNLVTNIEEFNQTYHHFKKKYDIMGSNKPRTVRTTVGYSRPHRGNENISDRKMVKSGRTPSFNPSDRNKGYMKEGDLKNSEKLVSGFMARSNSTAVGLNMGNMGNMGNVSNFKSVKNFNQATNNSNSNGFTKKPCNSLIGTPSKIFIYARLAYA